MCARKSFSNNCTFSCMNALVCSVSREVSETEDVSLSVGDAWDSSDFDWFITFWSI